MNHPRKKHPARRTITRQVIATARPTARGARSHASTAFASCAATSPSSTRVLEGAVTLGAVEEEERRWDACWLDGCVVVLTVAAGAEGIWLESAAAMASVYRSRMSMSASSPAERRSKTEGDMLLVHMAK